MADMGIILKTQIFYLCKTCIFQLLFFYARLELEKQQQHSKQNNEVEPWITKPQIWNPYILHK